MGGALTSRGVNDQSALSQVQLLQNQQMMPSNYSNQQLGQNTQLKQSQNEKIKSYSRKLAKLVSSGVSAGGGSASNSRTPNAKKKLKPTTLGLASALTQSINNPSGTIKAVRSGLSTSRGNTTGITPSIMVTSQIYNNGSQNLQSARSNLQLHTNNNGSRGQSNTTFDMDEHIKNVMKSVERRNRQIPYNQNISNINPLVTGASSSYLQTNLSQLLGSTQMMNQIQNIGGGNNGSKTARNQIVSNLNEYSPDQGLSLSKSPKNRNQGVLNQGIFAQAQNATSKNTVFSNFSNNNYFIGQKKNSQQSHSLGKKQSYQGNAVQSNQSTILVQQQMQQQNPNNASGSLSRKRGSTKRDTIIMLSKQILANNNQSRQQAQDSEIFSATQKSLRGYEDAITLKKKRTSLGSSNQNQVIQSHAALHYAAKKGNTGQISGAGNKTQRINTSSYNRQVNQSYAQGTSNSGKKKQSNWFSPPSSSHINNLSSQSNAFLQQNVLSAIDNNSSQAMIDRTQLTSQFISPRSFLNKSGAGALQNPSHILSAQQQPRHSIGDRNPLLLASYDTADENNFNNVKQQLTFNQAQQHQYNQQQQYNNMNQKGDWQKIQRLSQLKFFQNCTMLKYFRKWRGTQEKQTYLKNRLQLSDNLIYGKSQTFGEYYRSIMQSINVIKNLSFISDNTSQNDQSKKVQDKQQKYNQNCQFNEAVNSIKNSLEKLQNYIVKSNNEYERRIRESGSVGRRGSNIGGNDLQQKQQVKKLDKEHLKIMQQRCNNFDKFLKMSLIALVSSITCMLQRNRSLSNQKINLQVKFQSYGNSAPSSSASQKSNDSSQQLQMYATNSDYYISTTPTFKSLLEAVSISIQESDQLVYNNRKLIEILNKIVPLFFNKSSQQWDVNSFYQRIDNIMQADKNKPETSKEYIVEQISRDIDEADSVIRRMEDLKQIIQFDERWAQQNSITQNSQMADVFIADIESNRETWTLMERFQNMISQIPAKPLKLKYLTLDFKPLFEQLSKIPKKVIMQIERKVAASLESDTLALKQDLNKTYEILQQVPSTLNVYVEQVNTLKFIKDTINELNNRHDSIKKLSLMCQTDNRINVKESVSQNVRELEQYIGNLPNLIRHCQEKLDHTKPQMELQMKQSCVSLSNKIKAFEKKYIDHYLKVEDINKFKDENQTSQTLSELKYRQKMIDEMKQKAELYQECIKIMNIKEQFSNNPEITCFEDQNQIEALHTYTLKLWTILEEWRQQRNSLFQKPFLKVNFSETADFLEESISYIEQRLHDEQQPSIKQKLQHLGTLISQEMTELQLTISHVKDLRKECIKKKHWLMIFNELGMQSLVNRVEEFTLHELQVTKVAGKQIYSYNQEIREIIRIAEVEQEFEDQYNMIKTQVDDILKYKLVEYQGSSTEDKIYLISEFDIVQQQLEEFIVILKKGQKSPAMTDVNLKDNFISFFTVIENMANALEKLNDAQKMILTLDAIFSQTKVQTSIPNDYKKFIEIRKLFKNNITGKLYQNPSIKHFSTIVNSIQENLEKIISTGTLIQKSIEDYLEAKRLAFPRFFFMTDKQFLEFVELAEQNIDFNRFINLLFPGVSKVFLDQPLQALERVTQLKQEPLFKVPPPMINDLSQVRSEMIDISQNLMAQQQQLQQQIQIQQKYSKNGGQQSARMINQKNQIVTKPIIELDNLDKIESQYNSRRSQNNNNNAPKPTQVMGLISTLNELFLFEKKVPYQQNKVECWLQGAETNMQETVGKLINYAVNTFPKQSLDEWILDYPQQVILTTIHLILTHEINELFEEMRKDKENGENGGQGQHDMHNGQDSDDDYTGATPKTPDTRDLIKNSQISHRTISQHVSQKSSIRFMRKKGDNDNIMPGGGIGYAQQMIGGVAPRKVSTHEFHNKGKSGSQSNYSSQNQQRIRNQQQMKNSQYYSDEGHQHDLNAHYMADDQNEDFTESELEALDLSRERKKFAQNMFGSDFDLNLVADNKDDTMRILQEKSFRGLYLRLQFWINQICKSLYMSKGCNQSWKNAFEKDNSNSSQDTPKLNLDLHPVQRLVMQTIINFLSYMRDVVFELKNKKVDNVEDFDWQKQMRLTWNGKDSGCKVDCGAWTTQQANEYFGAQQRVPLTPLTNKYFVFISAAFREKSAVLFRTVPSHDYCGDVFKEFSSICSVPFKEYQCNPKLSMKSLMQFLNGAALASVWIFFEHVDKLDYVHLQTFNKEIQMVQQQFIIAELSQDSSVITAHITVGNQSISQCQRSIERIREQASLESKQLTKDEQSIKSGGNRMKMGHIIGGGGDIKIEDNVDDDDDNDLNYRGNNGSPSGFYDEDDQSMDNQQQRAGRQYSNQINILNQQDKLNRQQSKEELQYIQEQRKHLPGMMNYDSNKNQNIMQNLSQIEIEGGNFHNDMHNQLEEDCEEIKLDEGNNNSMNGGNSKINSQNKVCFGVFASISHSFNLRKEKWATEVSAALQSAFRVLSLTRPEMPIITSMLLKSEGFREYKNLSVKINDALMRVQDLLNLNDRDDSFSISVRDLKRLSKCASCLLEQQIIAKSQSQISIQNSNSTKSRLITYNMEKKSRQQVLKEIDEEEERDKNQKQIRSQIENVIICHILGLFLHEKLNSYYRNLLIQDDKAQKDIKGIISSIFGKNVLKESEQYITSQQQPKEFQTKLMKVLNNKGMMNLPGTEMKKLKQIYRAVNNSKPVCVIGQDFTGKSLYIRTIVKDLFGFQPLYINPQTIGNYREMYGIYDPISTTQQIVEQQIGAVKNSIFTIIRNETQKDRSALIIEGEFDLVFNETIIPYLEYQTFAEQNSSEANNGQSLTLMLPNGMQETLKKNIPIIYEMRSLDKVSPRFIHAIQVVNTQDNIDVKQMSQRIKSRIVKKLLAKFKGNQQNLDESVQYCLNEIIVPALYELRKAKYLDQINVKVGQALQWCCRSFLAIANEIKSLQNIDQTMIKISLITIIMSVGNVLSQDGRKALEEIFSALKNQIGVRGSIFNYCMDYNTLEIIELRQFNLDSEFIVNPILLRATYYSQLMLKNGKDMYLKGETGSQKSTIIRYLIKNHQQDISSRVIRVPVTCFVTQITLRSLLSQKHVQSAQSTSVNKPTLIIIDDANIIKEDYNFDLLDYLNLTKKNNYSVFNSQVSAIQKLNYEYVKIVTSTKHQQQNNSNMISIDNQSQEFGDFMKTFISRKLQIAPSCQTQISNIIFDTYQFLKLNEEALNVSSSIKLSNLHLISSLVQKINQSQLKDQNLTDTLFIEVQRTLTDRQLYPQLKVQVYDNLIKIINQQLPSETLYKPNQVDSLIFIQNGQKYITSQQEAQEFLGNYQAPVLKQICNLYQNIKKQNNHFMYICQTGSDILKGIEEVSNKLKFKIQKPQIQKYRDSFTLIEQINSFLLNSLKTSSRLIILIQDSELNDLSYIDYLINIINSIKESTAHCSLSYFNSLDVILESNLRQQLIETARELYNQQISHSPHSGISSPASPSSLTASITDSQLLMNALSKISQNVKFIFIVNSLQNYQTYATKYNQIETLLQVAIIPEEKKAGETLHTDIQNWVHDFSLKQTFSENYLTVHVRSQGLFNNEYYAFYIPEHKLGNILQDPLFDTTHHLKVNSELNLTIPSQFTQSKERQRTFVELTQTIKQFLYKQLASQKQFYQQYFDQYERLQADFMKKILTKDQSQVTKNHVAIFNLMSIQDKIDLLNQQLKYKDQLSKQKEKERSDISQNLDKLKDDLYINKTSSDGQILSYILRLNQVSQQDFKLLSQTIVSGQLNDIDQEILQALQAVLQTKKSVSTYLQAPQDLVARLQYILSQQQSVSDVVMLKYQKQITKKLQQLNDSDKSLIGIITKILNEMFKKCQLDKKYSVSESKIKTMKEQLSLIQTSLKLYQQQMQDTREEVEDLLIKEKNMKAEIRDVLKRVDMKDIKALRNDYKLKSLLKQGKKSESKLDKVKIRMKNLEGDSIILACSVAYLGAFSVSERMEFRKQLSEKLLAQRNIESSEYWQNSQSEQIHSKYFKKIIQNDLGLKSQLFNKLNHLFVDSLYSEFLFCYLFSPTTPVIYDSVGNYQQELTDQILDELNSFKVKVVFSSDYMIQEKIQNALIYNSNTKKHQNMLYLNDLCDYSKHIQGKSQDQSILHRLAEQQYFRRIDSVFKENMSLSLPALTLFSSNSHFNLNQDYLARATIINATYVNKNEAWIEIKQILLKHFLPDNYQKLSMIKQQTQMLRMKLLERQKAFEQLFMKVKSSAVEEKDHKALEDIRLCYIDIKQLDEDYQQYNQAFHNLINEHPLLASYSNIFVILYFALKELSKFTDEITYSWKIYTKVIDMIIAKIIRDLTMNLKNKENEESDGGEEGGDHDGGDDMDGGERRKKKKDKEFTIDEEFFHSVIMPSIYSTIVAGIKQEHVSLFNLIFSLEIALKKTTVNQEDKDFFVTHFFKIKNCYDWRLNPHKPSTIPSGFIDNNDAPYTRIKLQEYMLIKRDILKIYPDLRKLFETIEIKIGKEFTFKEANNLLYQKLFKYNSNTDTGNSTWKDLPLIKKLNMGFLCPDDEWRSKITQFVYEELTTIFDFTEDLNKLHNFIKTASWSLPIALFTSNSINIVNTVCSIASYYGVGLEVLRTDYQQSIKKHERYYANKDINDNLKSTHMEMDPDKPLSNEAACVHYEQIDSSKEDRILMQKHNYQRMFSKDELEIDDKQITQNQSSIQLIEKCAENGTWVLISTLKFPSFWYKISRKLEKMAKKGKVLNTFRLFFDLQGYSLQEIPESFLFNHSVKFYLTEKNNEDMEGFNDVWANILNDDLLNAKDLQNVPVLEPPSDMVKINLNLESNMYDSSMDSLIPQMQGPGNYSKDQMNPNAHNNKKTVKEDKITYSMSTSQYQSKDTIQLPQIFTQEHMRDIMHGGNDLRSPTHVSDGRSNKIQNRMHKQNLEDEISEISIHNHFITSGLVSGGQSLMLMDDMSRVEGNFLSELNQAFARKMSSNKEEQKQQQQQHQQPKYEMVKKPAPNHKRQQPPQKQ